MVTRNVMVIQCMPVLQHCAKKNQFLLNSPQWGEIMREAKIINPYIVNEVKQEVIFDFQDFSNFFTWPHVKTASIREISIKANDQKIYGKWDFNEEPNTMSIFTNSFTKENLQNYELKKAYNTKISTPLPKKQDLIAMVDKNLTPNEFKQYYYDIRDQEL